MKKYEIGALVEVIVTGSASYGIFVSMPDGSQGLIHISEISDKYVRDCSTYATVGSTLEAVVLGYGDKDNYKLSIRQKPRRARQMVKEPIKPPLRKEVNRKILEDVSFETINKVLESQIDNAYHRLTEGK